MVQRAGNDKASQNDRHAGPQIRRETRLVSGDTQILGKRFRYYLDTWQRYLPTLPFQSRGTFGVAGTAVR